MPINIHIQKLSGDKEIMARIRIMQEIVRRMISGESLNFVSV